MPEGKFLVDPEETGHPTEKLELVLVTWLDSAAYNGWRWQEDCGLEPESVRSVGWFCGESETAIQLAAHITDGGLIHGPMNIPRAAILEIEVLKGRDE